MRRLVAILAIAIATAACGATGAGAGSPTPTPPSGGVGFDVTATETDHAVTMHVGQRLEVALHGGTQFSYQQVKTSDPAVLEPTVDPAATAVRGVTLAAFKAAAAGKAQVTAVGAPVCASGQACPMYAVLYTLTVTVTP